MRVFYDHQVFANQNFGGISRYFYELIRQAAANGVEPYLSLLASNNVFARQLDSSVYPFLSSFNFRGKRRLLEKINRIYTTRNLKKQQYDLFHPTFYHDYFLKGDFKGRPLVVTCHDMINEKFKELFPGDPTAGWKKRQLEAATTVLAVSENTKQDIMEILGVPSHKIFVTPLASSFKTGTLVPVITGTKAPGDYLLYVGLRPFYKNFLPYVEAVAPLLKESGVKLVCAGGGAFTREEMDFLKKLDLQQLVVQTPINDQLLAQLYSQALAFVFPSKYEGFGIPTLEAFSMGTPAILADRGSLPEVGGDAAVYFNPYDPDSMFRITQEVIHDADLRSALMEKGLARAKDFSWEKTAKLTFDVYETVIRS